MEKGVSISRKALNNWNLLFNAIKKVHVVGKWVRGSLIL
ncbi:hypothetical protein MFUM_360003 [Methylacidiphilum fumariolicum SolV]|uniref:Uncharacterized protein n=2 Tax=Candidatus Methylacidiphilum fumarolicum TaxID=591154 RepID=I0JY16_METFB|nr:conserved protein of unknown function [Candidatus Methylacidiphilum fumarolicum]CCG92135.1 hypothetical protein MFUM_360003 [Methylacidiphilum fumariolicum SolV]